MKLRDIFKKSKIFLNRNGKVNFGDKELPKGAHINAVPISAVDDKDNFIKIVPVGNFPYHHSGPHEVTTEHIQQMAKNFTNRGLDLLFDYEHESLWFKTKAAGWSTEVEAREDGLYIKYPEFTPNAQKMVDDREYRYFSPVYYLNARDKQGNKIGATIDSVALTNRPYMDREIEHIKNDTNSNQEDEMKYSAELKKKLGLPEDATDEQVDAKLDEVVEAATQVKDQVQDEKDDAKPDPDESTEELERAEALANSELIKRIEALEKREADVRKAQAEALVNAAVDDGKIVPADKEVWLDSALSDYDKAKEKLDARKKNSALPGRIRLPENSKDQEDKSKVNSVAAAAEYFRQQGRFPGARA